MRCGRNARVVVTHAMMAVFLFAASRCQAQISFASAVALALSASPKVRMAEADVQHAREAAAESRDVYIPAIQGSGQIGYSYGPPLGEPTLFSFGANSLAFNFSQKDYIRAARSGLAAADYALTEAREEVAEDAAVTYLSLDRAMARRAALAQQFGYARRLTAIVQERLDAGQDTELEVLRSKQTAFQVELQMVQLDDELRAYRRHLSVLIGLPDGPMSTMPDSIPALPEPPRYNPNQDPTAPASPAARALPATPAARTGVSPAAENPGIESSFATARAKQEQAFGDARFLYRPQISFFGAYSRFSTFNNYQVYYPQFANHTLNAIAAGVQITIPLYDRARSDRARQSAATAYRALEEARNNRDQFYEGRAKLERSGSELALRAELAEVNRQIAQQELDAILIQLQAGTGNSSGRQMSPKDEFSARIQERLRYLELLDSRFQLQEAQIRLLRQNGQLDAWLKATAATPPPTSPAGPVPIGPAPAGQGSNGPAH